MYPLYRLKMDTILGNKSSKIFNCKTCDYTTHKKSQWNRHILTKKHKKRNGYIKIPKKFQCVCGKEYKYSQGLSKHKKICNTLSQLNKNDVISNKQLIKSREKDLNDINDLKTMIKQLLQSNKELQEQVVELAKLPRTTIKTQTNNTFNLNNFLNIECKDAMNWSDFIQQLTINFDDLIYLGNNGFVKSIENTFVKQLLNMEETKRPIHCTDKKRKSMYIKDNNKWEKDIEHQKLQDAIRNMNIKQIKTFSEHHNSNPNWLDNDNNLDEHNKITVNVCSYNPETRDHIHNKIINTITDNTSINK